MQKNSNFVKFNKITAAFCIFVVLILSIIASDLLISQNCQTNADVQNAKSSMYKQLAEYGETVKNTSYKTEKMHNFETENANSRGMADYSSGTGKDYDGSISVLYTEDGTVHDIPAEDYITYALIAEMPLSFDLDALMAQAVAIRTYTVRNAVYGSKHENADVCDDHRCCQSMIHPEDVDFDISKAVYAVNATKGIVAVYDGEPILAAYHSSSYGTTKSSEEVWGGELSYLVPVFAPEDYDTAVRSVSIEKEKVKSALENCGLGADLVFCYDEKGRCSGAVSLGKTVSPSDIRKALGLRSESFTVTEDESTYTFECYGFGHGVGMSQYGADALAKNGYSFYEILGHYYTGISFAFLE